MKKFIIFCILLIQGTVFAQNHWIEKDSIISGRYFLSSFVIGDKAYAGWGATDAELRIYSAEIFRYSPATDTWETMAPFPGGGRYAPTTFSLNGKGYLCLGVDTTHNWRSDVWEFDPATSLWAQKNNFPGGDRYNSCSFVIGNKAYVCGGSFNAGENYLNDLWCYDPIADNWTQKASLPTLHKSGAVAFSLDGKGYVGCGAYSTDEPTGDFYEYDPGLDSWTQLPGIPALRTGAVAFVIGETAFVGTGTDLYETHKNFWSFNPVAKTWTPVILPPEKCSVRVAGTAFNIGSTGYILAGRSEPYDPYYNSGKMLKDMWAFGSCNPPAAWFTYDGHYAEVHFTDSSSAGTPISRLWDFGDSTFSTDTNPVHTYENPDSYKVCLTVTDSCGTSTACRILEINLPLMLNITVTPSQSNDRLVQFHDQTPGTNSWRWNFGDGQSSQEQSPSHLYKDYGLYRACLTAGNGQLQGTACDSIQVVVIPSLHASNPVLLYPNPSQGILWMRFFNSYPQLMITVYDYTGNKVFNKQVPAVDLNHPMETDLSRLPKGIYFIRLNSEGFDKTWKMILQ